MGVGSWFRRMFGRTPASPGADAISSPGTADANPVSLSSKDQAKAWLDANAAGRLDPPRDPHNRFAWDQYWKNHLEVGPLEQSFADQMSSDGKLPKLLAERGVHTILCAGNGLSMEAISLAVHGFDVTALDISIVPAMLFAATLQHPNHPIRRIPGIRLVGYASAAFDSGSAIDPELCPPMHRSAEYPPVGGGSLRVVSGDLGDPDVYPGPFDVVIERRTLQLFPEAERLTSLDRLIARLSDRGVFVSHEHQGNWRPGDDRSHYARSWLASRGFVFGPEEAAHQSGATARMARLTFSTG